MISSNPDKNLLYHHEILKARFEIREFYLNTVVREVYENIGQVLSLVRMQLYVLEKDSEKQCSEGTLNPSDLVSQTIRDLRRMCEHFYADAQLLTVTGFIGALEQNLKMVDPLSNIAVKVKGVPRTIDPGTALIVFRLFQLIISAIKDEADKKITQVVINFTPDFIYFNFCYRGTPIDLLKKRVSHVNRSADSEVSIVEKLKLIQADLQGKTARGRSQTLSLKIPAISS